MTHPLIRFAVIASIALSSPLASAQSPARANGQAPLAQALTGGAREAYASAQILSNNGDFSGALAKFGQAYDLSKDPRLLFNMAICERSLHAYARMQALLIRYEREAGAASDKAEVDSALAAIRNFVGTLMLTSNESGAVVTVDSDEVGSTPWSAPISLDLGKHTVSVSKPGFDTVTQAVTVAGGSESAIAITLVGQRHVAQLVVTSDPDSTVSIDGAVAGKGRFDGPLPSGVHDIRVAESGKLSFAGQVDLRDGERRTMQVTLEAEGARKAAIWPWIIGGAVVAAGAAVGGYFLFRQEDHGAAPVSGNLANVQLSAWGR